MYDMSVPNAAPGTCEKCRGTGLYRWGAIVNGKASKEGPCFSCRGTGQQSKSQIRTNNAYNYFKLRRIALGE
jgi:DnaJ-class molecular chaperone